MMEDTPLIFGISDGPFDGPYSFVEVLGVVEDGHVQPVTNPKEHFPDRGTVFLFEDFWIPPNGQAAVWRVAPRPSEEHTAKYNVISRGRAGPLEILPVPYSSSDVEAVRRCLLDGIDLNYVPDNQALIQLRDGVVIGPISADLTRASDLRGFFCGETAFREPIGRWNDISDLRPFRVAHHGEHRCFSSFMKLPSAPGTYDLADFRTKLEVVLRFLASEELLKLTRAEIEALSDLMRDPGLPERVTSRAEQVLSAVSEGVLAREQVESLLTALMETAQVKAELERVRASAREAELNRLQSERANLFSAVEALRKEHGRLERELAERQEEADRATDTIRAAIAERLRAVQEDASDVLSSVMLLRPFLDGSQRREGPTIRQEALPPWDDVASIQDLDGARSSLERALQAIGVRPTSAEPIAVGVLAAALSGQPAVFSGSLATIFARTCGLALAGESSTRIQVPVGLLEGGALEDALRNLEHRTAPSDPVSVVILEGLNRSSFDVYADGIRSKAIQSAIFQKPSDGVICLGTVIDGPSALPLSPALTELGPVFDTDTVLISTQQNPASRIGGRIAASDWTEWSQEVENAPVHHRGELREILRQAEPRALWEFVLDRASRAVGAVTRSGGSTSPLALLSLAWIIPHASSRGVLTEELMEALRLEVEGSESGDGALERVLDGLNPAESPG